MSDDGRAGGRPVELSPAAAAEVTALLALVAPEEGLDADELDEVLWDPGGVVWGWYERPDPEVEPDAADDADGATGGEAAGRHLASDRASTVLVGVVAATTRPSIGPATTRAADPRSAAAPDGHLRVLAVHPAHRRRGIGTRLVGEAERWLRAVGAERSVLGGEAPVYLWPGVDADAGALLRLAERLGYRDEGSVANMVLDASFRAPAPEGIDLRRVVEDDDVDAVTTMVAEHWPRWSEELRRGIERATVFGAFEDGAPVGFCAHSALRTGWLGPMATLPAVRHRGVGAALVSLVCLDLSVVGRAEVEIAWVGPAAFYERLGAEPGRRWRRLARPLT